MMAALRPASRTRTNRPLQDTPCGYQGCARTLGVLSRPVLAVPLRRCFWMGIDSCVLVLRTRSVLFGRRAAFRARFLPPVLFVGWVLGFAHAKRAFRFAGGPPGALPSGAFSLSPLGRAFRSPPVTRRRDPFLLHLRMEMCCGLETRGLKEGSWQKKGVLTK